MLKNGYFRAFYIHLYMHSIYIIKIYILYFISAIYYFIFVYSLYYLIFFVWFKVNSLKNNFVNKYKFYYIKEKKEELELKLNSY